MPDSEEQYTPQSRLSALAAEIKAVQFPDVRIPHPSQPHIVMSFRTLLKSAELQKFRNRSIPNKKTGDIDARTYNGLIVASSNTGISTHGIPLVDDEDDPVTFRSPQLMSELGVMTAAECAAEFLVSDVHLAAVASLILEAAGVGERLDAEAPNPT